MNCPAAATIGPTVSGMRAPIRWLTWPATGESNNMITVSGTSDAPASSAE
jgi:hypothetical protein